MSDYPTVDADPGVTRQVLSDHPELMIVAFNFNEQGAEGKLHHHPNIQATFVQSGRFIFSVDGKKTEIGPGDSIVIPTNVEHGCVCLEPGTLIDSFTPRRDDFL
ncbi:MAG: cupin domain-containing protein [Granulosicoccus sp.]|nr:cupin domain-containing protein [Granulosicoccus sp.]